MSALTHARTFAVALLALSASATPGCSSEPSFSPDTRRDDAALESSLAGDGALDARVDAGAPDEAPVDVQPVEVVTRPPADVRVIITADNAYGFGYGSADGLMNYFGGVRNTSAGEIFNCPMANGPEIYTVPGAEAPEGAYLYIVSWSDRSVTNGVLGQFTRGGASVYTGDARFEVCATGVEIPTLSAEGPTREVINREIGRCNRREGDARTTSGGWVDMRGGAGGALAIGEDNTTDRSDINPGNEFPRVCGIDPAARWMWFNWDPMNVRPPDSSAFIYPNGAANAAKEFLVFRLAAAVVPPP